MDVMLSDSPDLLATSAAMEEHYDWNRDDRVKTLRAQVNSRCQDLLFVVSSTSLGNSTISSRQGQSYRIELLHRSVKDFLDQSNDLSLKLEQYAGPVFDVHVTFIACYVFLIKKAPSMPHQKFALGRSPRERWSVESLLHMRETSCKAPVLRLLRELDRSMQRHHSTPRNHWANDICLNSQIDSFEYGNRDLIGHMIEFGLTDLVMESITANPALLGSKKGRPYLDYALHYDDRAGFWHISESSTFWSTLSGDFLMVETLLNFGCDVNEKIDIYKGRAVWDLYLAFLYENKLQSEWYGKVTWLLTNHGAAPIKRCTAAHGRLLPESRVDKLERKTVLTMNQILTKAFGENEARAMCDAIEKNRRARRVWFWPFK